MKTAITSTLLLLATLTATSQVGKSLNEIKADLGAFSNSSYTTEENPSERFFYITYEKSFETEASGNYEQVKAFYFKSNSPDAVCLFWLILEPRSETNSIVKHFNKNMVKQDDMLWKDYETGLSYSIEVSGTICVVKCFVSDN